MHNHSFRVVVLLSCHAELACFLDSLKLYKFFEVQVG
jgi:hypothetical protein